MSHVARVALEVNDLECLEAAAKRCGLVFNHGQTKWNWYGEWMNDYSGEDAAYRHGVDPKEYGKCDHAISVPKSSKHYTDGKAFASYDRNGCNPYASYEVGVKDNGDGTFTLLWDFYAGGNGLQAHVGKNGMDLVTAYAAEVAMKQTKAAIKKYQREHPEDTEPWYYEEVKNKAGNTVVRAYQH